MEGDTKEKFYEDLYDSMYRRLTVFVFRSCGDSDFTKDVVQETFLEAYRKIDIIILHPKPKAWMYTTAKNKMMKMGRQKCMLYPIEDENIVIRIEEKRYKEIESEEAIKSFVGEKNYHMICDYFLNGFSSTEVAEKYHLDKGSIRMRMSRLRRRLATEILRSWLFFFVCTIGGFYGL